LLVLDPEHPESGAVVLHGITAVPLPEIQPGTGQNQHDGSTGLTEEQEWFTAPANGPHALGTEILILPCTIAPLVIDFVCSQ
jgi:hypothetical protein